MPHFLNESFSENISWKSEIPTMAVQFVDEKVQWMHMDVAGPVWSDKKRTATGFGVSTLIEWIVKNSS